MNKEKSKADLSLVCTESSNKYCPVFLTLSLIANKWSIQILYHLHHAEKQTMRFGQLQKSLNGISQRELSKHLREFEKTGIVTRRVYAQVPPKVEYIMTNLGRSLCDPIEALSNWAEEYGEEVQNNRANYEKRNNKVTELVAKTA